MRIVSQDELRDVNYGKNDLYIYLRDDDIYEIGCINQKDVDESGCLLGDYSSKEKALKVMKMIRSRYRYILTLTKQDIQKLNANHIVKVIDTHYFHMPQDNEVE